MKKTVIVGLLLSSTVAIAAFDPLLMKDGFVRHRSGAEPVAFSYPITKEVAEELKKHERPWLWPRTLGPDELKQIPPYHLAQDDDVRGVLVRPVVRIPVPPPIIPIPTPAQEYQKGIETRRLQQLPFDHPAWVPNEEIKRRALERAYELNGNKMCCGSIDVSDDPVVHPELKLLVDPDQRNALDEAADNAAKTSKKKR